MTRPGPLAALIALYWRERRGTLLAAALLAGLTVLAGVALLGISGWFITATALAGAAGLGLAGLDVFRPAAAIRFLAVLRTGGRYGERVVGHEATLALLAALRERLFRGLARPEAARALMARPARLLFRLTVDVDALDSLYLRLLAPAAAALLTVLVVGGGLALLDGRLGLGLVLACVVVGVGVPLALRGAAERAARSRAAALELLRLRAIDLMAGQTDLLMTGRLDAQRQSVLAAEATLAAADDRLDRLDLRAALAVGAIGALLPAAALVAVAALLAQGALTVPQAAMVVLLALAVLEPFGALRRGVLELGRTRWAARRLRDWWSPPPPAPDLPPPPDGSALVLRDVGFRHAGAPAPLFRGVSLTVAAGERVAVVGPSGAGKSTLLDLMAGERIPQDGYVLALPRTVLGQRTDLFRDSLRGNLLLAAPDADEETLWHALAQAGLDGWVRALPAGLDTMLGEGGTGLSQGQGRRLALARLILRGAPLWLLDEPTEGLDGGTARAVLARLADAAAGRTLVLVTHLRREAELVDRLLLLDADGRLDEVRRGDPGFDAALDRLRPD
ncbi:thiol reductant ABC exporter subunit CydC [Rhodocista pekingensis]|uniref:Thiol reductant ABC exporter subunit CydC n=1 Tax=Rhodocista pekingensis TaxID=201185 RepID=A0ABW2KZM5_9PROT